MTRRCHAVCEPRLSVLAYLRGDGLVVLELELTRAAQGLKEVRAVLVRSILVSVPAHVAGGEPAERFLGFRKLTPIEKQSVLVNTDAAGVLNKRLPSCSSGAEVISPLLLEESHRVARIPRGGRLGCVARQPTTELVDVDERAPRRLQAIPNLARIDGLLPSLRKDSRTKRSS